MSTREDVIEAGSCDTEDEMAEVDSGLLATLGAGSGNFGGTVGEDFWGGLGLDSLLLVSSAVLEDEGGLGVSPSISVFPSLTLSVAED